MSVNGRSVSVNDSLKNALQTLLVKPGGGSMKASEFYRFPVQLTDKRAGNEPLLHTMDVTDKQNNTLATLKTNGADSQDLKVMKEAHLKEQQRLFDQAWAKLGDNNQALQERLGDYCSQTMFFPLFNALHQSVHITQLANQAMMECLLDVNVAHVIPTQGNGIYQSEIERLSDQIIHVSTTVSYNQLIANSKIYGTGKQADGGDPFLIFDNAMESGKTFRSKLLKQRKKDPHLHNTAWRATGHIMEMRVEYIIVKNDNNQWVLQGVSFYYDLNTPSAVNLHVKNTPDDYLPNAAFYELTASRQRAKDSPKLQQPEPETLATTAVEEPAHKPIQRKKTWARLQRTASEYRARAMDGRLPEEEHPGNLSDSD